MGDHSELKRLSESAIVALDKYNADECNYELAEAFGAADDAFHDAAGPTTVLALIAENERLESERADLWRGKRDVEATRDTKSAVIAELKAEIAGLRTGYEAYERVNAELKAEVEALREEVALGDKIIADRDRLLNMFDCPAHGQCIPYAMEQIEALRKDRTDWQAECLKRGFEYVRESDDHYVLADVPEMADLLGSMLGVEVRSKENDAYEEANSQLNEQIEGLINTIHAQESMRKDAERLQIATALVQKLCDAAGNQPSVATGYLHDILAAMGKGEQS